MSGRGWLIAAGVLSLLAALVHVCVIVGGADWYRFFGAGEGMAHAAARGSAAPALITLAVALILGVWALYAFSGAGVIRRLPLLRTGLVAIAAIYLLRAAVLVPTVLFKPALVDTFLIWSSLVVLAYGLTYAVGTWRAWPRLRVTGSQDRLG